MEVAVVVPLLLGFIRGPFTETFRFNWFFKYTIRPGVVDLGRNKVGSKLRSGPPYMIISSVSLTV
jgi:hypothetical protein